MIEREARDRQGGRLGKEGGRERQKKMRKKERERDKKRARRLPVSRSHFKAIKIGRKRRPTSSLSEVCFHQRGGIC